jgi:hypothetical protein
MECDRGWAGVRRGLTIGVYAIPRSHSLQESLSLPEVRDFSRESVPRPGFRPGLFGEAVGRVFESGEWAGSCASWGGE